MLNLAPPQTDNQPVFDVGPLKQSFDENGFVVLRGIVSKPVVQSFAERLADEFERWRLSSESFRGGGLLSGHLNCYPGELARGAVAELRSAGVFDLAQQLFPTDPKGMRLGCNFNLPGSFPQHYHMDGLFLRSFLVVNVTLVDTDLVNGAIDLIPKTHKRFYKYWEFALGRVNRGSQRILSSAGDVLIRRSTLWHRGMPNRSQKARPMLAVTLGEDGVSTDDPFAYADGRVEFQTNWFNPSKLGRLRERTAVRVPLTYSAYRFAHSLVSNKGYASF